MPTPNSTEFLSLDPSIIINAVDIVDCLTYVHCFNKYLISTPSHLFFKASPIGRYYHYAQLTNENDAQNFVKEENVRVESPPPHGEPGGPSS